MPNDGWLPPEQWLASLAKNIASAGALFTDADERALIVKPHYRDHWLLVGGVLEKDESPERGCRREVAEEIGIDRPVGRLLVVDWTPPVSYRPLPLIEFVFDGGMVEPDQIRLDTAELDEFRFASVDEALPLLTTHGRRRLTAAFDARRNGVTHYRSGGD